MEGIKVKTRAAEKCFFEQRKYRPSTAVGKRLVLLGGNEQRTFHLKRLWDWLERSVTINSSVTSKYAVYELAWSVKSPEQEGSAVGDNNRPQRHWYPSTERQLCNRPSKGLGLGLAIGLSLQPGKRYRSIQCCFIRPASFPRLLYSLSYPSMYNFWILL